MTLPRPLVLFLAACGGGAIFGMPLVLAAMVLGAGPTASPASQAGSPATG